MARTVKVKGYTRKAYSVPATKIRAHTRTVKAADPKKAPVKKAAKKTVSKKWTHPDPEREKLRQIALKKKMPDSGAEYEPANKKYRMWPSGDLVDEAERERRLSPLRAKIPGGPKIFNRSWDEIATMQQKKKR